MLDLSSDSQAPPSQDPGGPATGAMSVPDLLLLERARARDMQAWEAIMQRYNQRLFRIARSILQSGQSAIDLVADSYLKAFSDLEHCEPPGKLGPWLARISFTQAMSTRHSTALAKLPISYVEPRAVMPAQTTSSVPEEAPVLERAIDALPEVFRTVFVLRVIEGISGVETAACLGINETTARTRLHRAQQRFPAGLQARMRAERSTVFKLDRAPSTQLISWVFARIGHPAQEADPGLKLAGSSTEPDHCPRAVPREASAGR